MVCILGVHTVVAVAKDFPQTLDFYDRVLGLTSIAGDRAGAGELGFICGGPDSPSRSVLTFMEARLDLPLDRAFRPLTGLVFGVALGSLPAWRRRLDLYEANVVGWARAFGCDYLCVTDPNGLELALVEEAMLHPSDALKPRVRRLRSVEIQVGDGDARIHGLATALGFAQMGQEGPLTRFSATHSLQPIEIDVLQTAEPYVSSKPGGRVLAVVFSVDNVIGLGRLAARLIAAGFQLEASAEAGRFMIAGCDGWSVAIGAASLR